MGERQSQFIDVLQADFVKNTHKVFESHKKMFLVNLAKKSINF